MANGVQNIIYDSDRVDVFSRALKEYGFDYIFDNVRNVIKVKGRIKSISWSWDSFILYVDKEKWIIIGNEEDKYVFKLVNIKRYPPKELWFKKEIRILYESPYLWVFFNLKP